MDFSSGKKTGHFPGGIQNVSGHARMWPMWLWTLDFTSIALDFAFRVI